ncbi:phosphonate ABC transporter permease protein PhnE2 [Geomicrobium sp. JCM 19037]|uniref:phosphonate ABC transporter, permease protein PhnE n=1 Tax=Geomicrobium sp. JCM 19037 TaxID=1460634 RepID=UPI00045F3A9B|nr:phosphonate ABC transporter, permease protein PhnE [Geomicrobium sp. JCM 19037]GAK06222.1 phosphonate ABC transporter permease protein PhnE2 [Geomicrobium sp. JCM 19037]
MNPASKPGNFPLIPRRSKISILSVLAVVALLYIIAAYVTNAAPDRVINGLPQIFNFVFGNLIPPNWSYYDTVAGSLLETWNIALLATTLSVFFCLPIAFLSASNINTSSILYNIVRFAMNVLRTIPDLVLAVIFVGLVGIGAMAGIYALFFFSVGILAKLISETIESIDPDPLEAIRSTGGNTLQVIWYGVMPQILPHYISYSLYVLEINVRASVVLGFVGAGGVGSSSISNSTSLITGMSP